MAHHRDDEDDDDNEQINQKNRNQAYHGAQNADASQNALPDWLNVFMGRPRVTPNAIRAQQQRDATTKLFEHYYGRKASVLNPTIERATKRERELLFQREEEMLGLELNKDDVYPSTSEDDAEDDVETAQLARFILTCHHVARVIAGDASQRRDMKLVADEFKPLIGKKGSVLNALNKLSKDQIKELNTSIKLIASKPPTPQIQKKQSFPAEQQLLVIAVLVISELDPISIITSQLNSTVLQPLSNDDAIATICILINISTLISNYAINRPDATIIIIIFQSKRCVEINYCSQTSIIDAGEGERGARQSADGKNSDDDANIPERLTYRIQEWNKINAGIDIQTGALPNWTSVEALQQLEEIQKYRECHAPLPQMVEYARYLEKEIKEGIVLQTDQIKVINPTFLVQKPSNKWRQILDCRQVNAITNQIKFKMEGSEFIKQILEKLDFATTLDLENAFHHIKVSSDLLPYFGFACQRRLVTYSGLAFG
ncbi:MAG: hypothetical protein EZS28_012301, partial [Streblomastix strix]